MLREASYSSLRMGLYDAIKILMAPTTAKDDLTLLHKIAAGCASGAIGSVIATPTDLVKIRFQGYSLERPNPYPHSAAAFADIWRRGGLRGLYTGATPTVARAAILTGSQLSSYDHSKRMLLRSHWFQDTPATHFVASVISGLVTATAVNPVRKTGGAVGFVRSGQSVVARTPPLTILLLRALAPFPSRCCCGSLPSIRPT